MADFKVNSISDNTVGTYTFIDYNSGAPIAKADKLQADTIVNEAGTGAPYATYGISFPAGQGLDFSASEGSGATSSILDDYEEGTWTPEFNATYSGGVTATGVYTKNGDEVTAYCKITASGTTADAVALRVSGLPYAIKSTCFGGCSIGAYSGFSLSANNSLYASLEQNQSRIFILQGDDVNCVSITASTNTTTPVIEATIKYKV